MELFSRKCFSRTTLGEIAKIARVTRGAIYWHFKDKTENFASLYERLHQPCVDMILQDISKEHPEPLIQLQDICIKFLLGLENDPQKRQVQTLFLIKSDYSGELKVYNKTRRKKSILFDL